jgi:hypothetical protein
MSEHRSELAPAGGSSSPPSRRRIIAAVSAISLSGLLFGALLAPVSADDVAGSVASGVSAEFDGNCVNVTAGGDGAGGSVGPQEGGIPSGHDVTADGTGTSEVSVCLDDLGEGLPEDPGDVVPGDPGGGGPGDLEGVVGDVAAAVLAELDGAVPGDPGDGVPGDPGGVVPGDPGDGLPGDPGGVVPGDPGDGTPGDLGELLPDVLGLVSELPDRIPALVPDGIDNGGPDGDDGSRPAVSPSATGSSPATGSAGSGDGGAPADLLLGGDLGNGAPGSSGGAMLHTGGTLPRTGGGLGSGLLRMIAVLGFGRAALRLAARRRPAAGSA